MPQVGIHESCAAAMLASGGVVRLTVWGKKEKADLHKLDEGQKRLAKEVATSLQQQQKAATDAKDDAAAAASKESEFVRSLQARAVDPPDDLLCPITFCPLRDAVSPVPCGHVFDGLTIEGMLRVARDQKKRYECPTCRGKIEKTLVPAYYIRQQVEAWEAANGAAEA